jgi:hypothetical protein
MKIAVLVMALTLVITTTLKANTWLSVEYLYWKVQEDQLYSTIGANSAVENGVNISNITLQNQKFEYTSGVRLAVGYDCYCKSYDLNFAWTYINPCTITNFPAGSIIIPFLEQTSSDVSHGGPGDSQWELNYNMFDLTWGREYLVWRHFSLHPNIGLQGGWINQTQEIKANTIQIGQSSTVLGFVQGSAKRRNNFYGIGPRIGLDLRYGIGSCLGVFSTASGALLYGNGSLKTKTFLSDTANADGTGLGGGPLLVTLNNPGSRLSPKVQILIGADWTCCLCQKYEIYLAAAYEVQLWWDQLRSINSIPQATFVNSPGADLMMQGLTLQLGFGF